MVDLKMPGLCPYLKFISVKKNHLVCDLKNEIDIISQTTTLEDTPHKIKCLHTNQKLHGPNSRKGLPGENFARCSHG